MDGEREYTPVQPESGNKSQLSPNPVDRLERHFKRRLLEGFIVLVPLLVTFLILRLVIGYVDRIFIGEQGGLLTKWLGDGTPFNFPGVGLVFAIVLLYVIGVLVSGRAGKRAVSWQNAVLSKIPVVKSIYGVAKQAADTISSPMGNQFRRVVFVEWPRPGLLALGFVTGYCPHPDGGSGEALLVVYIPTVPNPTSGNLAFIAERDVIETNMSMEDAMKIVFSGGTVMPDSMTAKHIDNIRELPPR